MATSTAKNNRRIALLLVVLSAAGLWASGRMVFVSATVSDDKAGDSVKELVGSVWDPAATPVALAMLAALVLSMAVQPLLRRILGVVVVLLAGVASFRSVQLLFGDADLARAQSLLTSGAATQKQSDPVQISDWARVVDATVHTGPVLVALLAAALGVIGGVILFMQPGEESTGHSRYETPEVRRAGAQEDLAANPDSSRVMWDAMDAGVDPTDDGDFCGGGPRS
ncbi:MAG TPA: TIGR02234 family membrane protein [Candidatus Corynebacterium gallistercoris]|uniref:TIGR02234 family membrane protein n=1 Tax=Candidatus Corynebacterium gallistercoris TaxID=2838530 RepID=A0A9D1RXH5_9CORY|nr:TIGR02234 family membrane protein [Candidatus Corynebacterium gallistercoris]